MEEKKKDKTEDENAKTKDKKSKRFHFRERFQGSPDKKKRDISIKFSTLKDGDESEEEGELIPVEYGLEANETVNVVEASNIQKDQVKPVVSLPVDNFTRIKQLLWYWRHAIIIGFLSMAHCVWSANYVLGFILGVFVTLQVTYALNWFQGFFVFKDSVHENVENSSQDNSNFLYPIFISSQYSAPPENPEKIVFEGWINEFSQEYSPGTYHISLTDTIHIRLEGSLLTLSNPSTKIPKRASWNEPEHKKLFNRQRLFDISGCKVQLLPLGLTHKRIWSKKYPICITLLKMSKLGVRYRSKGKITIEDDQEWLDPELDDRTPVENNDDQEIFPMDPIEQVVLEEEKLKDKCAEGDKPEGKGELISCSEDPLKDKPKSGQNDSGNEDEDEDEDFVRISPSLLNELCIYLFARCDRQKEIWFRRLVSSASGSHQMVPVLPPEKETNNDVSESENTVNEDKEKQHKTSESSDEKQEINVPESTQYNKEKQYLDFMNRLGQKKVPKFLFKDKESNTKQSSSSKPFSSSPTLTSLSIPSASSDFDMFTVCEEVMWVNAFGGRLLYDVLRDSFWLNKIQEKFQRKLSAIKLPYFMEELVISHIDFGETVPLIQRASKPVLNEDGIWVDLDIIYEGHFHMTIDTKLNLMKLKKVQASLDDSETNLLCSSASNVSVSSSPTANDVFQISSSSYSVQKSAIFDSDVEDSPESSSEEIDVGKTGPITLPDLTPSSPGGTASHKMLRMVDKIAASKYFQQVTDNKYIKRAMEGVSNTNIALVVEVKGLTGTLVLNFPPPPSDRLWYGFRPDPQLQLSAQPKVGDRTISLLHVSTWIERRLRREFQKLLVLPNMDDLIIPVMNKEKPS